MYKIKIKNSGFLKAKNRKIKHKENIASVLEFSLLYNDDYINTIERFKTILEVYKENTKIADFRVIDIDSSMAEDGSMIFNYIAESALNFLNDTRVGKWDIHPEQKPIDEEVSEGSIVYENMTVKKILEVILNNHNSKAQENKKIYLGNVTVDENVYFYTNFETSLNVIQTKLVQRKGGFLNLRENNNKYYLDYLKENTNGSNTISLGVNLKSISRSNNLKNIVTRLIPFGKDGLTIKTVNNNLDYIEDLNLIKEYGVIESVHKWDDVSIPENLLKKAQNLFKEINKNTYSFQLTALDLYCISKEFSEFKLSQLCTINNKLLNIKDTHRIIAIDMNLDDFWNSSITLSNDPPTATNNSTTIRQEIDDTKIELLITDKKIASKISQGEFESYQEQVAEGFKKTVKKGEEFEAEVLLAADKYQISMNGKLGGKTYIFDGTSFKLGGTDSGNKAEHTNNYSKWVHENGHYSIAKANGFFRNNGAGEREIKSCDYMVLRPAVRNGRTETVILPADFANKEINTDFTVVLTNGSINSDIGAALKDGAIRNLFLKTISWNKTTRELVVQPCLQKIGLTSKTFYGWDSSSTTPGNPIGEGSVDMIIMAQI